MELTRRSLLRRGTAIAVGSAAAGTLPALTEAKADDVGRTGYVGAVGEGRVRLRGEPEWLPTEGFPPGWTIEIGDRVAVSHSATSGVSEEVAIPMVHWEAAVMTDGRVLPANGNEPMTLEASTVYSQDVRAGHLEESHYPVMACIVDNAGSGPGRVIAIRGS